MDYKSYFDWVAQNDAKPRRYQRTFHQQILSLLKFHIAKESKVLEWGCGRGDLLAGLKPSRGLGIDLSPLMLAEAQSRHNDKVLEFRNGDLQFDEVSEKFDVIIMDYLAGYLKDIQKCLKSLHTSSHARTRLYITSLNYAWRPIFAMAQPFGLVVKQPPSNWLSANDLTNLLTLAGWEVIYKSTEQLFPFHLPLISTLFNRFLVRLPVFKHFGATLLLIARPRISPLIRSDISCSVIVPVCNESGNIRPALERIPVLGKRTEIIFVEGHSNDDTWNVIQSETKRYQGPHKISYCQQSGEGKWDAVHAGFTKAKGDILVIQDGDLTAPPEDLPKFYDAIVNGHAEFANGSRLVYPMEGKAMQMLNFFGNKFFALVLSYIIGQPIKDSLCGTKMILRKDYERLLNRIKVFGEFDPFGDFNLIFGSALLDLRIRDIPVRYRDRIYGSTNILRFRHGVLLLRMCWFGLRNLKFPSFKIPKIKEKSFP